jgi:regulator of cell morphogenesis and NO signaling
MGGGVGRIRNAAGSRLAGLIMTLDPSVSIAQLVLDKPHARPVLARLGIDHRMAAAYTVGDLCTLLGLSIEELAHDVETARPRSESELQQMPLPDLIDHIEIRFHRGLERELPRLQRLARSEAREGRSQGAEWYAALLELLDCFEKEVVPHMYMEEKLLFPHVRSGHDENLDAVTRMLSDEHSHVGDLLDRLAALQAAYLVDPSAGADSLELIRGLRTLERDMHEHVRLENAVLFARLAR